MNPSSSPPRSSERSVRWVGGIIRPQGFKHEAKPLRLAVWMTSGGTLLDAAIVSARGPALLRQMLDAQLLRAKADARPGRVTVWPSAAKPFRELAFPRVEVRKDEFLKVVVEDQCSFGHLPEGLPVRAG
jgi:hypothetical protein